MALTEQQMKIAKTALNGASSKQQHESKASGLTKKQREIAEIAVEQVVTNKSDHNLSTLALNSGRDLNRKSTKPAAAPSIGAAALDDAKEKTGASAKPVAKTKKTQPKANPYKTYNQPAAAGDGNFKQSTKEYSDKRMQNEALKVVGGNQGKNYAELKAAAEAEQGDDYMSQYRRQILDAMAKQNRTRADIESEIAQTQAEIKAAEAAWEKVADEVVSSKGDEAAYYSAANRVDDLMQKKAALESELWMYDRQQKYSAILSKADYATEKESKAAAKDDKYVFINDINGARGTMLARGALGGGGNYAPYTYMTADEIGIYNYLYNTSGKKAANEYLDYLEIALNERSQEAVYEAAYKQAKKNAAAKAALSVASIPLNLGSGAGYLDVMGQKAQRLISGDTKPIDYNRGAQTGYNMAQGAREGAMEGMSNTGKFIYSTAMSMGDSLGVLGLSLLTGGSGATLLLGGSAATSTMHDAKENGANDGQALAMGLIAGAAETLMERLPLEKLLNMKSASGMKEIITQIAKQGGNEATEEALTTLANTAADALIMGDKSELRRKYEEYVKLGYTQDEAERKAKQEWATGLLADALGGFISGGVFGLGGTVVNNLQERKRTKEIGAGISTSQYTLQTLIEHVEKGYTDSEGDMAQYSRETRDAAERIKKDLDEGKNVSDAQKGKLANLVIRDNANFETKDLPQILTEVQRKEDAAAKEKGAAEAVELPQEDANAKISTQGVDDTKNAAQLTATQQNEVNGSVVANEQREEVDRGTERAEENTIPSGGRQGRFSDAYTGDGKAIGNAYGDARTAANRAQTASDRQNKVANLRIMPTSAEKIGIKNGGTTPMYMIPAEAYDDELLAIEEAAKNDGLKIHYFTGAMTVGEGNALAVIDGNDVYVKADSARYTAAELYDHEKFHKIFRNKPQMIKALAEWIKKNYDEAAFDEIVSVYYEKYNAVYDLDNMPVDDAVAIVVEEILADAYAGTNKFRAGADLYTDTARSAVEATGKVKPNEYNTNQGRGPPQNMTYDDVKNAVREVMAEVMGADGNKNTATEGGEARFSIERTKQMSWEDQINGALYGGKNIRRSDTLVVGQSEDTVVKKEVDNKPLAIPLSVLTKASSGKDISHSIKKGKLVKLDEGIKNAPITIINPERNAIVYLTNIKQGGLPILAAFDVNAIFDGDEVHKATSIHLQVDTMSMLESLPETATVLAKRNELDSVGATNNLRGLAAKIKFIDENVSQRETDVKQKFALSEEADTDGNSLTVDQQEYFAESKVRDESGNLLVMYHGTPNAGYTIFNPGTYFTQNKKYADVYQAQGASSLGYKKTAINPDTYKVYLNIKKPFDTRNQTEREIFENDYLGKWGMGTPLMDSGLPDWMDGGDLQEFLEEEGYDYDGLILDEGGVGGYGDEVKSRGLSYVVFSPEQVKSVDNKTPTINTDYRFAISDEVDSEYLDAVERGDMEIAQRIVNDMASEAMPQSKIRTEDGELRVVYHGTNTGNFTVFNPDHIGMSSGDDGFFGMGFYFAYSKGEASYYGAKRIIPAFLNLTNPFDFERELQMYNGEKARSGHAPDAVALMNFADKFPEIAKDVIVGVAKGWGEDIEDISLIEFAKAFKEVIDNKTFEYSEVTNEYGEKETVVYADEKMVEYEYGGEKYSYRDYGFQKRIWGEPNRLDVAYEYLSNTVFSYIDLPTRTQVILDNNREFTAELKEMGHDGAIQSMYGDEAVAFYPEQIKSAETVTYDDDGNIIPLSERFNSDKNDIRFAVSDEYDKAPENRTWEEAADRSVKSYAYAYPALRPYYQQAARLMQMDIMNSIKGERFGIKNEKGHYVDSIGVKRSTTENIARLLDNGKLSYKRINEALLTIIYKADDAKLMNKADVKKVEMELDTMLREGYTEPDGKEIPANENYVELLDAVKAGYTNVEEARAAYEADERFESYDRAEKSEANQRADAVYQKAMTIADIESYEDLTEESRAELGAAVDTMDEIEQYRLAENAERIAAELDEENELVKRRNLEYAEEANNIFDALNQQELDDFESRMNEMYDKAFANPDISGAEDTSHEHWESIKAYITETKRRQLRENKVSEIERENAFMPDGVSDEEILAAQEKYRQQIAAQKAADERRYEGLTPDEAEAAKEAEARIERQIYLEGAEKKNFMGSEALKKLGIKISRSIADYKISANLIERAKANDKLVKEMTKAIRKMHPSSEELWFARGIVDNDLTENSIPMHLDPERVMEIADYMRSKEAGRTDLFAAQKADINNRNRELASEKFKNAEKAKRISLIKLNYLTPRRAMMEMFGKTQGEEIFRTFFAPVRENDAERIRWTEKLKNDALKIKGADGKEGELSKEERAVTQMLMEGKAAAEMVARMTTGGKERVEEAARKILKGEKLRDETATVNADDIGTELTAEEERAAKQYAVHLQALEALKNSEFDGEKIDTVRVNNAAEHFTKQYDMMYEAINEFLVAHGEQPIGFIKGYAPHIQADEVLKPLESLFSWMNAPTDISDLRADIAGETHNRKPNKKWNPHFLSRGYNSETEYDVYKGFDEYVEYISEVFYHMDDIMRLRAASRYLRTMYTTEDSKELISQINKIRDGSYYDKMNFLLANKRIAKGQTFIGAEVDEALDKFVDDILNEAENKEAVSGNLVMWLDNYTNLIAGKQNAMDRGLEQQAGRNGIKALNKVINRLISAQVVGNVSSALNQMAQLPMTLTELGGRNVGMAIYDLVTNSKEMRRWATENDFLVARKGTTILNYQISDKVTNGLAKPLEISDYLMATITARAAYRQAIMKGMSIDQANAYSVQKAEDIMGSRNKATKPVAFSTKRPLLRLVNAYQIEVLNQWQHIIRDLPAEYKTIAKSRGKSAAAARIAKDIVLYLVLAALINRLAEKTYGGTPAPLDLMGIVGNFIASGNGFTLNEGMVRVINAIVGEEFLKEDKTFDAAREEEFNTAAAIEDTLYTLSGEVPFLNNVLAVMGLSDDKTVFAAGFADAKESFFGKNKEGGAIDHFFVTRKEREAGEQEKAEVLDGLYDLAMGVSEFIMGGRQLQKTIQGIKTMAGHGTTDNKGNLMYPVENTVGNWVKAVLFGKNALEKTQAYYASGASPLKSTRNEQYYAMVENGVDEDEAYRIVYDLAGIESDKDKNGKTISGSLLMKQMEYIMNIETSDEVKSKLAMSIASDAAQKRYDERNLESAGISPSEFMLGWAFYQSSTGKDRMGQTKTFLKQQSVSSGDIEKIIKALEKEKS